MSISMSSLFTSPPLTQPSIYSSTKPNHKPFLSLKPTNFLSLSNKTLKVSADNVTAATTEEPTSEAVGSNGAAPIPAAAAAAAEEQTVVETSKYVNPKWINGTWDLTQFKAKNGVDTDWDAVIDAEAKRRKWLQDKPETTSNDDLVVFDTSIIPWWAWVKRFHLPEAELLNGRAAMVGFFMAYFVDSLTGVGLVDQMGNFFCKTLLFVAVVGVLLVRKNEDVETLKKLLDETTFYDKQWQATWQEENGTTKTRE
ncbi:hypothetical protein ACFE04_027832 [Oxalis oulophora]